MDPAFWISRILLESEGQVVQIGSNDGKTGDPVHSWLKQKPGWRALFVEPVPYLFSRLKETYSGEPRFSFENTVINDGSDVTFYWVRENAISELPDLPEWYDQLGGFSRDHITKHLPQVDRFIESQKISGMTLGMLFDKYAVKRLDCLHIDTEGADFQILKQLDLANFQPRLILFERKHLSQKEEASAIRFLQNHYALFNLGPDILAISRTTHQAMRATLKPLNRVKLPSL